MSANGSAARRGKLTAGAIASRVALYDSGGIIETNQVRNKKNPSRAHCPRRVPTISNGSPGRIRTYNPPVNSRMLCR